MAGLIPGILTAFVYCLSMFLRSVLTPSLAPMADFEKDVTIRERARSVFNLWEIILLASIITGGIYSGILTPANAGALGALTALAIGLARDPLRDLNLVKTSLRDTANLTAMLFFLIVTAMFFSRFLALTRIPAELDALAIQEDSRIEYRSVNAGIMHACGHDGHTAMLLGAARYLAENRELLGPSVSFSSPPKKVLAEDGSWLKMDSLTISPAT